MDHFSSCTRYDPEFETIPLRDRYIPLIEAAEHSEADSRTQQ